MVNKIVKIMLNVLGGIKGFPLGREITILLISMSPILELRGGILAGRALSLDPVKTLIICLIGNLIPVPFLLLFFDKILKCLRKSKIKLFNKIANFLYKKANDKKDNIEKYGFWGIVLFVGIPLPGTGAWTGSLVASVFNMNKKKAFLGTILGILMAATIMMLISYGIF